MPKPAQRMIEQIQRTNRNYPQSFRYLESYYDMKTKLLVITFKFKRTGFVPVEALDNIKYFDLIGIQAVKPFTESTHLQFTYFYKEN
jgi:hypothetical protein